jgi:hypothetical protein
MDTDKKSQDVTAVVWKVHSQSRKDCRRVGGGG